MGLLSNESNREECRSIHRLCSVYPALETLDSSIARKADSAESPFRNQRRSHSDRRRPILPCNELQQPSPFARKSVTESTSSLNSLDELGTDLSSMERKRNSMPLSWQHRLSSTSPNSHFRLVSMQKRLRQLPPAAKNLMSSGSQSCSS